MSEELARIDIALRETGLGFNDVWRDDFALKYQVVEVREETLECRLHAIGHVLPLCLPGGSFELMWCVHHKARHHMLAGGCHVRVDQRLNARVDVWMFGVPSVLRGVVGPLHVFHGRGHIDEAEVLIGATTERGVLRETVEGEVHLRCDSLKTEPLNSFDQISRQFTWICYFQEGAPRI